jgi:hypothetical protein
VSSSVSMTVGVVSVFFDDHAYRTAEGLQAVINAAQFGESSAEPAVTLLTPMQRWP